MTLTKNVNLQLTLILDFSLSSFRLVVFLCKRDCFDVKKEI